MFKVNFCYCLLVLLSSDFSSTSTLRLSSNSSLIWSTLLAPLDVTTAGLSIIWIDGAETGVLFSLAGLCGCCCFASDVDKVECVTLLVLVTVWMLLGLDEELLRSVFGRRSLCLSSSLACSNENFFSDIAKWKLQVNMK